MAQHMDGQSSSLDQLRKRIEATDLIPSQELLRDQIEERFARLEQAGIISVADLLSALKNRKALAALSNDSGVDADYLALLGRAIRGFFPKPKRLNEFDWLDSATIARLEETGLKNTRQFHDFSPWLDETARASGGSRS